MTVAVGTMLPDSDSGEALDGVAEVRRLMQG
jgi:hypothetical protein